MKQLAALLVCLFLGSNSAHAITVVLQTWSESCAGSDGAIFATPSGGVAPYTYSWSTGATAPEIMGLVAGFYSVTVTDDLGATGTNSYTLPQGSYSGDLSWMLGFGSLDPCIGQCNGGFRLHLPRIAGGHSISTTPNLSYYEVSDEVEPNNLDPFILYVFEGACDGQTVELAVFSNCGSGSASVPIQSSPLPSVNVQQISASCNGADDGALFGEVTLGINPWGWNYWLMTAEDGQGGSVQPEPEDDFNVGTWPLQLTGMHPGDWSMHFETISDNACVYELPFTIPDLGPDCGTVSGTVHFETDVDCVQDGLEVGFPFRILQVDPGPLYGITANDGSYEIAVPFGSYDLTQVNPDVVQLCPPVAPVAFTVSGVSNATIDLADSVNTPFNMYIALWSGLSRVGFPFNYSMNLFNANGYTGENVVVTLDYDPLFTFISASPGVTSNTPGQIQWTFPTLAPFEHKHIFVYVQVPPDPGLLGSLHSATATATSTTSEGVTTDNTDTDMHMIVASYDPNDKQAFTSSQQNNGVYLLDVDTHIDYLIRFQNTGTDTAFNITVTDTISPLLDMASLQLLGASHPFTPHIATGNVLEFHFEDILLPDSNVNELASHGYVAFRLKPVNGIAIGSTIDNAADIFFDFNDPVRTNTASVDVGITTGFSLNPTPSLSLAPVPATHLLSIGMDGAVIGSVTILALDGREVARFGSSGTVDVSSLSPGGYVLLARTTEGREFRSRFVKR